MIFLIIKKLLFIEKSETNAPYIYVNLYVANKLAPKFFFFLSFFQFLNLILKEICKLHMGCIHI